MTQDEARQIAAELDLNDNHTQTAIELCAILKRSDLEGMAYDEHSDKMRKAMSY